METPLKRYGNDFYWFFEEVTNNKEIAIWTTDNTGQPFIMARAISKYDAKTIVDALLSFTNTADKSKLSNKELAFLH